MKIFKKLFMWGERESGAFKGAKKETKAEVDQNSRDVFNAFKALCPEVTTTIESVTKSNQYCGGSYREEAEGGDLIKKADIRFYPVNRSRSIPKLFLNTGSVEAFYHFVQKLKPFRFEIDVQGNLQREWDDFQANQNQ